MPIISKKGKKMPESPIRKLVPFAENAKKNGIEVFHLNIGQPDIKTPSVALEAIKKNTVKVLAYSRSEGSEEYRSKLAHYYAKNNIDVNANEIIITTGGSEALLLQWVVLPTLVTRLLFQNLFMQIITVFQQLLV